MKRKINIIFNIVIPTIVAYATFLFDLLFLPEIIFEYRWLAIIPFITVTGLLLKII